MMSWNSGSRAAKAAAGGIGAAADVLVIVGGGRLTYSAYRWQDIAETLTISGRHIGLSAGLLTHSKETF